jgi:hypothetical protein
MHLNKNGATNYRALAAEVFFHSSVSCVAYRWLGRDAFLSGVKLSSKIMVSGLVLSQWKDRNFLEEEMATLRRRDWKHYASQAVVLGVTMGFSVWWHGGDVVARRVGLFFGSVVLLPGLLTLRCSHDTLPQRSESVVHKWHGNWDEAWKNMDVEWLSVLCLQRGLGPDHRLIKDFERDRKSSEPESEETPESVSEMRAADNTDAAKPPVLMDYVRNVGYSCAHGIATTIVMHKVLLLLSRRAGS